MVVHAVPLLIYHAFASTIELYQTKSSVQVQIGQILLVESGPR